MNGRQIQTIGIVAFHWVLLCALAFADDATYVAVTADGETFEGRRITNWHRGDLTFSLNEVVVGRGSDLRFYRNRSLPVAPFVSESVGILEFFNADRLVGEVVGFREATNEAASTTPSHLFVETPTGFANPDSQHSGPLRVTLDLIKRVSWRGDFKHSYTPSTVYSRDGRRFSYRSLRWNSNSVRMLVGEELVELPFDTIAELHFPEQDSWQVYYRELKKLTDGGVGRLYRIEASTGLVATGNSLDFDAMAHTLSQDRARLVLTIERLTKTREAALTREDRAKQNYEQRRIDVAEKNKKSQARYDVDLKRIQQSTRLTEREKSQKLRSLKDQTIGRAKDQRLRSEQQAKDALARAIASSKRQLAFLDQQLEKNRNYLRQLDPSSDPDHWFHKVVPAWSLDEMWVPFTKVRTSIWFDTHEIPISRLAPKLSDGTLQMAHGFRISLDRSVTGEALKTDNVEFGWGIGVHGDNQLVLEIPEFATFFKTRIGLNETVGNGGCVQAKVYLNSVKNKPLFTSPTIVGGVHLVDTNWIELPKDHSPKSLILQVVANPADRPSSADPLNIRDHLNWLEPTISVDLDQLERHVQKLAD